VTTDKVDIEVQWQIQSREHCPADDELRQWARMAIESESQQPAESSVIPHITANTATNVSAGALTIRIVDTVEMRAANHQWRGIDKSTNVLSFRADFPPETGLTYYGDMLICADVLAAESDAQGKSIMAHWAHIVVHGTLHLLGYDHVDPSDAAAMERREIEILATIDVANPYVNVGEAEFSPVGGQ